MKLPSRKIIFILIACVIAVSAVYVAVRSKNSATITDDDLKKSVFSVVTSQDSTIDTDLDGLKDWEESLWGSDPGKADTDGDGTRDNDEVMLGRNPVVAGPDDDMSKSSLATATTTDEDLTLTDTFARQAFGEYISMKGGGVLDAESQQALIRRLLQSSTLVQSAKIYNILDIKTAPQEDALSIKNYGNSLGRSLSKHSPKDIQNEFLILSTALQTNDQKILEKIDPIIQGYGNLIAEYAAIQIPKSATIIHLNLLNSLSSLHESIRSMRTVFDDPLRAYVGVSRYQNSIGTLKVALDEFDAYFLKNGVTFEQGEDGYVFMNSL